LFNGTTPTGPLYQAGAPVCEAYAAMLQSFNELETLQQRVGNRSWTAGMIETGALPEAAQRAAFDSRCAGQSRKSCQSA
jgi:hypothetical protein